MIIRYLLLVLLASSCSKYFNFNKETHIAKESNKNLSLQKNKKYIFGSNNIPLHKNLYQSNKDNTNFDSVSGNISLSIYEGKVSAKEIKNFYLNLLPQLGWKVEYIQNDKLFYRRGEEIFKITLSEENNLVKVKFFIHLL